MSAFLYLHVLNGIIGVDVGCVKWNYFVYLYLGQNVFQLNKWNSKQMIFRNIKSKINRINGFMDKGKDHERIK